MKHKRMKLRKRDAKRIAKYLARNMDSMEFNLNLYKQGEGYDGNFAGEVGNSDVGVRSLSIGYKQVDAEPENELQPVHWKPNTDHSTPSFSEQQTAAVDANRKLDIELKARAQVSTEKDDGGDNHCVLTGYVVELIKEKICPNDLTQFCLTTTMFLERKDGELRIRFPCKGLKR